MARKLWIVLVDKNGRFTDPGYLRGQNILTKENQFEIFGIFQTENDAGRAAQHMSTHNPGFEVYIFESKQGFYNQPSPKIVHKVWTPEGDYTIAN